MKMNISTVSPEHMRCQTAQQLLMQTPVRLYFKAVRKLVPEAEKDVMKMWEELEKLLPHITLRLNYSFDPETDADTTDITVGELLLVVNSMLDRKTETEPENCFEELADYLEEYGEFMFECIFMMLGMVGDKLKYEKGEPL